MSGSENGLAELSASEAVIAFASWLSTRQTHLTIGAKAQVGPVLRAVQEFCEVNELTRPREDFHTRIRMPGTGRPAGAAE
jgi:hypothetical protein